MAFVFYKNTFCYEAPSSSCRVVNLKVPNNWCQCFTDIADQHAPIKKMKVKGVNIPWMTAELSPAMQDRDYHLKKAQKTKSAHHWSSYRKLRCLVNRKVREYE